MLVACIKWLVDHANAYLGQSNLQGLRFTYQEFFTVTLKVLCYKPPAVDLNSKLTKKRLLLWDKIAENVDNKRRHETFSTGLKR